MLMVDLCAGTGGWQTPFEEHGWQTVGVDLVPAAGAHLQADVRHLPLNCSPDLVCASPPCAPFSSAWNPVAPPEERDPDVSVWLGCVEAIARLNPEWYVVENTRQAAHWFGPADKTVGSYSLWGDFPPFDVHAKPRKGIPLEGRANVQSCRAEEAASIPYVLADALRRAVEWHTPE